MPQVHSTLDLGYAWSLCSAVVGDSCVGFNRLLTMHGRFASLAGIEDKQRTSLGGFSDSLSFAREAEMVDGRVLRVMN